MYRIRERSSSTLVAAVLCIGVITPVAIGSRGVGVEVAAQAPGGGPQNGLKDRVGPGDPYQDSIALRWNSTLLAIRAVRFAPMMTARAGRRAHMYVRRLGGV